MQFLGLACFPPTKNEKSKNEYSVVNEPYIV